MNAPAHWNRLPLLLPLGSWPEPALLTHPISQPPKIPLPSLARIGLCVFAFCILIFGIQHFMYAEFIATLITSWIPFKLFWTYLTGIGMIAVALAIFTRIYALRVPHARRHVFPLGHSAARAARRHPSQQLRPMDQPVRRLRHWAVRRLPPQPQLKTVAKRIAEIQSKIYRSRSSRRRQRKGSASVHP